VVLVAAGLVLAGCSGSGGGSPDSSSPVPKGIAGGPSASHSASKTGKKTTTASATRTRSSGSATSTNATSSTSAAQHSTTKPNSSPTSTAPRTSSSKPTPKQSGPRITVTPHSGLTEGQTVQVTGSGFPANARVIVLECLAAATGPGDCIVNILNPTITMTDSTGHISRSIQVHTRVNGTTCSPANPCIVAASDPHNPPAFEADAPISFG
jgi:hypothetical protein